MRVAIYQPVVPPYRLGILEYLARRGPATIFFEDDGASRPSSFLPHVLDSSPVAWAKPVTGGRRSALEEALSGYDAVVLPLSLRSRMSWEFLVRRAPVPVILWGHCYPGGIRGLRRLLLLCAYTAMVRLCDGVIAYGPRGAQVAQRMLGSRPVPVGIAPNTLLHSSFLEWDFSPAAKARRKREVFGTDGPVAVYVGRLSWGKRVDVLPAVQQAGHFARLAIVGDGPAGPDLLSRSQAVEGLDILGPVWEEERVDQILAAADVVIVPAEVGLIAVHAFACGTPVVTSRVDTAEIFPPPEYDYLVHRRNSWIAERLEADELAAGAWEVLDDRDHYSLEARATYEEACFPDRFAEGFLQTVRATLEDRGRQPHRYGVSE